MTLTRNLSLRIAFILLAGFVLLQLAMAGAMLLPAGGRPRGPLNLPQPEQARSLVEAIERTPPVHRAEFVRAVNSGLFTLRLERQFPDLDGRDAEGIGDLYVRSLPGRRVEVSLGRGMLARLAPRWAGPGRLASPSRLAIGLRDRSVLVIEGTPSQPMRLYLRQRALAGALGGLMVLLAIGLAVRRSTRPLVRLAKGVRRLGAEIAGPDLPVDGPRETRDLALAFNEMKARIGALVAERTRILAAIAHDMRTYLTRLRLRADYIDDADQRQRAVDDLAEMSNLLDDTLLFAKGAEGPGEARKRVDLAAELEALVALRREMGDRVTFEPAGSGGAILVSPLALRRAFNNLIDNGVRYGGEIAISLRIERDEIVIAFADPGPGVREEMIDRLAEPFLRAEPSRGRATGGAGLGLAIVEALVTAERGRVTFANRPEGGFLATLRFPRA